VLGHVGLRQVPLDTGLPEMLVACPAFLLQFLDLTTTGLDGRDDSPCSAPAVTATGGPLCTGGSL
jgi:hypothetical protein